MKVYARLPSGLTARHMSPWVTPEIHMDVTYVTSPSVAIQKWISASRTL